MGALPRRMYAIALIGVAAVLALAVTFALLRVDGLIHRDDEEETRVVQRLWENLIDDATASMQAAADDPTLVDALGRGDLTAASQRLGAVGLTSVALLNGSGKTLAVVPAMAPQRALDERRAGQILAQDFVHDELVSENGGVRLLIAKPFGPERPADRVVVAVRPIAQALAALSRVFGGSVFLVDGTGALLDRAGPLSWDSVRAAFRPGHGEVATVGVADATHRMLTVRLPGAVGESTLYMVALRETTLGDLADSLMDTAAALAVAMLLAGVVLGLHWYFRRAFAPFQASVTALTALAEGNIGVAVLGAERQDEAGQLARTVLVFRDRSRALQEAEARRARHWLRQQAFIRKQMHRLAETLPDQGRMELLADLRRIESASGGSGGGAAGGGGNSGGGTAVATRTDDPDALAVAFEVMAERVRDQHAELDGMVRQLRAALDTKTELVALQKQFEIARRMQEAILPRRLPDRPDLEVEGLLIQGAEFEGSFYDYFLVDEGRLVILLGQVSGGGLAAGFMAMTARSAVRALASAGLGPADCLSGANEQLVADNAAGLDIALAMAVLTLPTHRLVMANAGMPDPFLVRRLGDVAEPPLAANPAIGQTSGLVMHETVFDLPGTGTVVFTGSGLIEGANRFGVPFGRERMLDALREVDDLSAGAVVTAVAGALREHSGGAAVPRDRLCVALRVRG